MMHPRVHTDLWVQAHVRRCNNRNVPAFVVARGDNERGGILLKINRFEKGVTLLQPMTGLDGGRVWIHVAGNEPADESKIDSVIQKRRSSDPDLWVVEIEDANGEYDLGEPIED